MVILAYILQTHRTVCLSLSGTEGNYSPAQSPLELAESLEQLRWLENGYVIKVGISDVETIGIDTPQDLARAEKFLQEHFQQL